MLSRQPIFEAVRIKKAFAEMLVLDDVTFRVHSGETLTIMGPSGSGKTTLLRILAGLEKPDCGEVILNSEAITGLPPEKRELGFVFQHYALFPHMAVYDNLAYPLRLRRVPKQSVSERVTSALNTIDMIQLRDRKPAKLSGGERQRVALMRSLIYHPSVLLLDEPFAALDYQLVQQLQAELWKLRDMFKTAMILVTHDCPFAMAFSDQILVLRDGHIQQIGPPREVFDRPANKFVAEFLGPINCIPGELVQLFDGRFGRVRVGQGLELEAGFRTQPRQREVTVAVRPSRVKISPDGANGALSGVVKDLRYLGARAEAEVWLDTETKIWVELKPDEMHTVAQGDIVSVRWDRSDALILTD